jgi:multisubunit Na+/H+ antiporter MnhG subunit
MVSEEADQLCSGFLAVHRLSDFGDRHQSLTAQVTAGRYPLNTSRELLEILLLRGTHRMLPEEWDHHFQQFYAPSHNVTMQVFFVVIAPLVSQYLSHSEKLTKLLQTRKTSCALRDRELVSHLIAGLVAPSPRPVWLPNETE